MKDIRRIEVQPNRPIKLMLMASALALTAGCASRRTSDLPPPPPSAAVPATTDRAALSAAAGAVVPGSRADFLRTVASDRVFFEFDSYALDSEARAILDEQAAWLLRHPSVAVTVEGHADERGTREYNLALGERRAKGASDYLQSRGIPARRITTISWGKERPAVEGSHEAAWAQNRRAVTVVPQ